MDPRKLERLIEEQQAVAEMKPEPAQQPTLFDSFVDWAVNAEPS